MMTRMKSIIVSFVRRFSASLLYRTVCGAALLLCPMAHAEVINVYTSANFAPLMLADGRGVYPELITHLNRQSTSLQYRLHYLPRKRLEAQLENGSLDGIVIGMTPEWLDDTRGNKYKWTAAFAKDRFALVSLASNPINPARSAILTRGKIGVTTGYVYPGLEKWFAGAGLTRMESTSDETNIEKLLLGRIDCAIVAESMVRYFMRTNHLGARLKAYPMPGEPFERRFLVQHRDARLFEPLSATVRKVRDDPSWRKAAAAYQ